MVPLNTLFFFATTSFAAVAPQPAVAAQVAGFAALYADLQGLDYSVKQLTATIELYQSGVVEASPIFADVQAVNVANRKAYQEALLISVLNTTQSEKIVQYVADPIAIDIPVSVKALNEKKAPLVAANLRDQILAGLNLLLGDHETLSAAIAKKLAPITLAGALVPTTTIDLAIREAITNFSV